MAAGAVLSFVSPVGLRVLALVLGSYALLNTYVSLRIAVRERDPRYALVLPLIFLSLHLAYGLGSIVGLARIVWRRLDGLWQRTRSAPAPGRPASRA